MRGGLRSCSSGLFYTPLPPGPRVITSCPRVSGFTPFTASFLPWPFSHNCAYTGPTVQYGSMPTFNAINGRACTWCRMEIYVETIVESLLRTHRCGPKPNHIHPSSTCIEHEFRRPRVTQSVAVASAALAAEASDGMNARTLALDVVHF